MIQIKYGRSHSDATNDYEVLLGRPMTVREFIEKWMERNPFEWGYFGIYTAEPGNFFGKPNCEYKRGKLLSELPTAYLDAMIKSVKGSGGYTRSDFIFEVDLPEIMTPSQGETDEKEK